MPECQDCLRPALIVGVFGVVVGLVFGVVLRAAYDNWAARRRLFAEVAGMVSDICHGYAVRTNQASDNRLFVEVSHPTTHESLATLSIIWRGGEPAVVEYTLGERACGHSEFIFGLKDVLSKIVAHVTRAPLRLRA